MSQRADMVVALAARYIGVPGAPCQLCHGSVVRMAWGQSGQQWRHPGALRIRSRL